METVIIADNLINDYCGYQSHFTQKNVSIGRQMIDRILGIDANFGNGPLPIFLRAQKVVANSSLIFFRDRYEWENPTHQEYLERLGEHCIKGSIGEEFIEPIKGLASESTVINCAGHAFPIHVLRDYLKREKGVDIFDPKQGERKKEIRFLLVGFHTERRIFSTANVLKNLLGFQEVAVFSHFLASMNKESHFTSLRYQFPDSLIRVINSVTELETYLEQDLAYLRSFGLESVKILPAEIRAKLKQEQQTIVESICMHWSEATLKPLGGGFSGSALFLAYGKQGSSTTEPMVIKIDKHYPIRMEIKGYHLVKDFLGKHIPTFTLPVSKGEMTGIGMELAAMEGAPSTLQDHFGKVEDDYGLNNFLKIFDRSISMLSERAYHNTLIKKRVAPFRHFMLHISQQSTWLAENIANLQRHETDQVDIFPEMIVKMFDLIRKNDDGLQTEVCVGHGDLNFANIIVDRHENLWVIDWTHADFHPLEIDFAKMENDLKFVMSRELVMEDLPRLREMENFLLSRMSLPEPDQLSEELYYIKWDLRFKKIYLSVKKLREVFMALKGEENWLIYKIALLRYALHTLSFDKSIDAGECSPTQLWYTLISINSLLFELIADDYHLQIRSEKPENYPARYRISIDMASWNVPVEAYKPPYFVSEEVLANDRLKLEEGFADPEGKWEHEDFITWGKPYQRDDQGKPLNPIGRTGIQGRGNLGLWGSNPMIILLPIRYAPETKQLEILISSQPHAEDIICVHLRRGETEEVAFQRATEKIGEISKYRTTKIHEGYLYDPRQTDHAWVDAQVILIYWSDEEDAEGVESEDRIWKDLDHTLINSLHSSHGIVVRKALQHIYDEAWLQEAFVQSIIEKTG
jgi:ADP-ribose pyrophosphatase